MRTIVHETVLCCALLAVLLLPSMAGADGRSRQHHARPRAVPEFDLAAAGAVGALLAGGGYLLARRRK